MKLKILCFMCFIILSQLYAQQNQVGNHDFEYQGPNFDCNGGGSSSNQDDLEATWSKYAPWTVPAKWKPWNESVGSPDFSCNDGAPLCGPKTGRGSAEEFICQPLATPLQIGHAYYIEYYVKNTYSGGDWFEELQPGLKLLTQRPRQRKNNQLKIGAGDATLSISPSSPFQEWFKVSGTTPGIPVNYSWVNLGRHSWYKNGKPDAGFLYWDGIKIVDVGGSYCPEYNFIQNATFDHIGKITYRSSILTIAGNNVDPSKPQGLAICGTESKVRFQSAELVSLMDGFGVQDGAEFEAVIAPCSTFNDDCPLVIAEAVNEVNACNAVGSTYSIGSAPVFDQTYSWSLGSPCQVTGFNPGYNYLSFLSSTTSSNPTFTQPQGYGIITYVLTVTNSCGKTASTEVTINVDQSPNPNPPQLGYNSGNFYGNFDPNSHQIAFYVTGITNNVEEISIQITNSSGVILGDYELENVNGLGSTGMLFTSYPDTYAPCTPYFAHVRQKNHCSDNLGPDLVVPIQSTTSPPVIVDPVPNFFSPNGDEANNVYSMTVQNAASYNIWVYDAGGVLIYTGSGSVTSSTAVVWDGTTNHNNPIINPMNIVCDGWYPYVIEFHNCNGTLSTSMGYAVQVLGVDCDSRLVAPGTSPQPSMVYEQGPVIKTYTGSNNAQYVPLDIAVYPNPSQGSFKVEIPSRDSELTIEIINAMGGLVKTLKHNGSSDGSIVEIQDLPHGLYFVVVKAKGVIVGTNRVIVTK